MIAADCDCLRRSARWTLTFRPDPAAARLHADAMSTRGVGVVVQPRARASSTTTRSASSTGTGGDAARRSAIGRRRPQHAPAAAEELRHARDEVQPRPARSPPRPGRSPPRAARASTAAAEVATAEALPARRRGQARSPHGTSTCLIVSAELDASANDGRRRRRSLRPGRAPRPSGRRRSRRESITSRSRPIIMPPATCWSVSGDQPCCSGRPP